MTKSEEKLLVSLLKRLHPSYYPKDVFDQFCRLNTVANIEVVPFIYESDPKEVTLIKRPKEDIFWSNMYHTPGCIIRPTDTIDDALTRVLVEELGDPEVVVTPRLLGPMHFSSKRGNGLAIVYEVYIKKPIIGKAFKVNELPENIIVGQEDLIFWGNNI